MSDDKLLNTLIKFTNDTMKEPKKYSDCYVAFLDILGFKKISTQWTSDKIKNMYDEIRKRKILIKKQIYLKI